MPLTDQKLLKSQSRMFSGRSASRRDGMKPNPHKNQNVRNAGFSSGDVSRLLSGWTSTSNTIDYYLQQELRSLRARSRSMVRINPYGKRFIGTMKSNIVGPSGVGVQAQSTIFRKGAGNVLDTPANDAIEAAFKDWSSFHCDFTGKSNWIDLQNMAISCAAQDGEYLFIKHVGPQAGKYGFQLQAVDPELLDTERNDTTKSGEIRLGIEYDKLGRVLRYYFRKPSSSLYGGGYQTGDSYSIEAARVIHGFISEWPDQSRGVPWMHSSLERAKHLEKYDEAAIVKARSTAATMAVLRTPAGDGAYTGNEDGEGEYDDATIDQYEAGTIKDIGDREIVNLDSDYPHQMYAEFVKSQLRGIASGLGISYHALSGDLEGVNYSSIRAGVLEDREIFKGLQNWFVRSLIQPVFTDWINHALTTNIIKIGAFPLSRSPEEYHAAHYQGRRWAWVDPQKDGKANELAINSRLKSISQIIREQGDDPESVWNEIKRDKDKMESLGIQPVETKPESNNPQGNPSE
jgi:lambda family phage portal protein